MQGGLDALLGSAAHHRAGDIAAAADDEVRLDLFHHLFRRGPREGQVPQGDDVPPDVVEREFALETRDLNVMERVARLGDQAVLHALFPACKMDLSGGVGFFQGTRNGQRRVDMAGRAAGSDQNFHTISLLIGPLPFRLGIACRI